ncbi:MAG: putative thiamine biosynthesis protein ThiH [Clostridia bacterium]|jgi:2-iminoacetate synthase ThiH|nr:putative thiamine biosynthesis protein ThiH [Clostridia bacterium]
MVNNYRYETFVPLYITNHCDSQCKICNLRSQNKNVERKEGDKEQILSQLKIILEVEGISAVCFLTGEYKPGTKRVENLELILWCIEQAFMMGFQKVYFNIGSLSDSEVARISEKFNGDERIVLSLFQETYHRETYRKFFGYDDKENPKSDFNQRLSTPERWMQAGFKQVDIGVLLGLRDPEYDVKNLIEHAKVLSEMGARVHISLPRIRGVDKVPYDISDHEFKNIVADIAKALPEANIIVTTREDVEVLKELLKYAKIISPGSSDVLPYTKEGDIPNNLSTSQFQVAPIRKRPSWVLNSLELKGGSIRYYSV